MKRKLLAFGCSWTYGDELVDPALASQNPTVNASHWQNERYRLDHCYAGLVAQHFDLDFTNLSFSGSSLESMTWALNWYLRQHQDLSDTVILAGLTSPVRKSWPHPHYERPQEDQGWNMLQHSTWLNHPNPDIDPDWYTLQRVWTKHCHCEQWEVFNLQQTITAFDYARLAHGARVVQFPIFKVLDQDFGVPSVTNVCVADLLKANQPSNLFCSGGHPNEQGHQIIANHLINHIKHAKILA